MINNRDRMRFEVDIDGALAHLEYQRHGDRLVLVHTEVPAELEGRGVGGALVTAAIEYAAGLGLSVTPACPFARGWLERHPDVAERVVITPPPSDEAESG